MPNHALSLSLHPDSPAPGLPLRIDVELEIDDLLLIEPAVELQLIGAGQLLAQTDSASAGAWAGWLPRGRWRFSATFAEAGKADEVLIKLHAGHASRRAVVAERQVAMSVQGNQWSAPSWSLQAGEGSPPVDQLSWKQGHQNWFFRHFDHAAGVMGSYMLGDSELLRGRILDVGCGDGISDLGLFLRHQPELLIGVDPFRGYERLLPVCAEHHLPLTELPEGLSFQAADGNHLPFADDSFDVVLSWGSVEHIAGGYKQALREIKRVLRPDGLFFVHPGLYYSNYGHHLGEFCSEPFFHLTMPEAELKELVLNTPPSYIDRAGEFATPAQYWQWYKELNPITVTSFEAELRALDFEFYRAAVRTEELIEYSPALQRYPIADLATLELYLSCYNRKQARPANYRQLSATGEGK